MERSWNGKNNSQLVDNQSHVELILNLSLRPSEISNRSSNNGKRFFFLFANRISADISTTSRKMGHAMNHCMCTVHLLDTLCAAHAFNV